MLPFSPMLHVGGGHLCEGPLAESREEQDSFPVFPGLVPLTLSTICDLSLEWRSQYTRVTFPPPTSVLSSGTVSVWKGKTIHLFCAARTPLRSNLSSLYRWLRAQVQSSDC